MRLRYLVVVLLALAAVAILAGKRLLYPKLSTRAATLSSPPSQSYLVILGVGDKVANNWDGSITATGATILGLQGWRFGGADSITGTTWKLNTRVSPALNPPGPVEENGVIVTISAATAPVTFDVQTPHGNFSFSSQDVPFGVTKTFLAGRALAAQTGSPLQLTSTEEEEDFPPMAQSGGDVYLTYTRFVHGDRSLAQTQSTKTTITDFGFLARTTG